MSAAVALAWAGPAPAQQRPRSAADCGRCHSTLEFLQRAASAQRISDSLVVTRAHLARGAHASTACADCHLGVQAYPHDPRAAVTISCERCHAAEDAA